MKKKESSEINSFLAFHVASGDVNYSELSKLVKEKFGEELSYDSIRKRIKSQGVKDLASTFSQDLLSNNFDPENWSHGWLKTESSSIFIKNKDGRILDYMQMRDEIIKEMNEHAPVYPKIKRGKIGKHLLVVDPADPHFGKYSRSYETRENYDLQTAEKRFMDGIDSLIQKSSVYDIHSILFVIGNDMLHTDNPFRKTTAGTHQDTDGQWWEHFQSAKKCYVSAIERLVQVADVKLVFCPSNHDFMSGYMLADSIFSMFRNNKNVTAYSTMEHRKYVKYGNSMIGFTHGDGAKNTDLPNLMLHETRGSQYKFGYFIIHHGHHKDKSIKTAGSKGLQRLEKDNFVTEIHTRVDIDHSKSISVEMVRTPSPADAWHDRNGYINTQAMEAFIFHPEGGQVARLTHYY